MKKLIPIILFAFAPLFTNAQAYTPLNLDNTSFWVHHYYYYHGFGGFGQSASARVISYVEKDTLINSKSYHKVIGYISKEFQNTVAPWHFNQFPMVTYLREDSAAKKVYLLHPMSNVDSVYLDFNLQVADTVNTYPYPNNLNSGYPTVIVDSILNKQHYNKILRTTFWEHPGIGATPNEQIEMVGLRFQFPFNVGGGEWNAPGFTCLCYSKKDTIEYLGGVDQWTPFVADSCYKQTPLPRWAASTKHFELSGVEINFNSNRFKIINERGSDLNLRVINMQGKVLRKWNFSSLNLSQDLNDLPKGIYILSVRSSKGVENRKVLIH